MLLCIDALCIDGRVAVRSCPWQRTRPGALRRVVTVGADGLVVGPLTRLGRRSSLLLRRPSSSVACSSLASSSVGPCPSVALPSSGSVLSSAGLASVGALSCVELDSVSVEFDGCDGSLAPAPPVAPSVDCDDVVPATARRIGCGGAMPTPINVTDDSPLASTPAPTHCSIRLFMCFAPPGSAGCRNARPSNS